MEADKVLGPAPLRPFYYGLPSKDPPLQSSKTLQTNSI